MRASSKAARRSSVSLIFVALLALLWCDSASAAPSFDARRFAALVVDSSTGNVLYTRNADAPRFPASLTKVMTLYMAFDAIAQGKLDFDDRVTMSKHAASQPPSKLGLKAGQSLSVREAIDILVVKSANDVAAALGETIAGSEAKFAALMTAKARALGMAHTTFRNASGLPDRRQTTTARDLVTLAEAFLRDYPQHYKVFDKENTVFHGKLIWGHNALLRFAGIDGFKTGYTSASGFNLLTSGVREGRRTIAVLLGGPTSKARDRFMADMIQAGFTALTLQQAGFNVGLQHFLKDEPAIRQPKGSRGSQSASSKVARARSRVAAGDSAGPGATGWWVQIGAFGSAAVAKAQLKLTRNRRPDAFKGAIQRVERSGGLFKARLSASSARSAREICRSMIKKGEACLAVRSDDERSASSARS